MIKLVNIKNEENINIVNNIINYNAPEKIYVPVSNTEDFKLNDYVYKNTFIGENILSISGMITDVNEILFNDKLIDCFVIENDYKENSKIKHKKEKIKNIEDLKRVLEKYNLSEILNKIKETSNVKNLVVTSIDEEIYSAKEFMRLSNNYREILDTMDLLANILSINKMVLAAKNTSFKSIKKVKSIIGSYPNIKINLVPDKYLISRNDFLCEYLNYKMEETLILTTTDIFNIYNIVNGKSITDNLITISGNAIKKSLVINTKLGVMLKDLIKEYIEIIDDDYEIYINGYLNGKKTLKINKIVITNDINYVVINKKENRVVSECINCGACMKICPYNINVKKCYFNKLSHKKCIGCGLCNFICPSNIDLKKIVKSDSK